jgi:FRG domain
MKSGGSWPSGTFAHATAIPVKSGKLAFKSAKTRHSRSLCVRRGAGMFDFKVKSTKEHRMPTSAEHAEQLRRFVEAWKQNPDGWEYIGDNPFPNFVLTDVVSSWDGFLEWVHQLQGSWCFRGQREAGWTLSTSLDRKARRDYPSTPTFSGYYHVDRDSEESKNLRQFTEQDDPHTLRRPAVDDIGSWYAAMQHYGTPTRFLDWSVSPYVAAYFAFEHEAVEDQKYSAIWALDMDWLEKRGLELLPHSFATGANAASEGRARYQGRLLSQCREAVIVRIFPQEPNTRMIAQQGVLLCKLFHEAPFSVTLMRMMFHKTPVCPVLRKLAIHISYRSEFLARLKQLNVHARSLFPDVSHSER